MATKFADRAFISVNGARIADVQSASLKQNKNARAVKSMTSTGTNPGFVQGNIDIDITMTVAAENKLSRPKLELIDYENSDVQLTFERGADKWIATKLFLKDVSDDAPGVGDESKASFNLGALELTDAVGNSLLFNVSL